MGSRARNFVLEHRRAGGFAQAVLAYLADCMNDQTGRCYPSREKIAEYFSAPDEPCTVKRVERALARLRALGFISSVRVPYSRQTDTRKEGGWHNAYTLVGFETGVTSASDVTPKTYVTPTMERGHPQNVQGVTPNLERGHPQNRGINQKEPEENQKRTRKNQKRTRKNQFLLCALPEKRRLSPSHLRKRRRPIRTTSTSLFSKKLRERHAPFPNRFRNPRHCLPSNHLRLLPKSARPLLDAGPPLHARSTPMPLSPMSTRPSLKRSALGTLSKSSPPSSITPSPPTAD